MVVFTCNRCGDSLKKNKVDQHTYQCGTNSLSCVDCLKDFNLQTYASHYECITEDQKYGGLDYKQQEFKGKNKQNDWVQKIKLLINEKKFPADIQNILKSLVNYDNIPRKKPKFSNFVKNSFRIRDEQLIGKIWDIFESSIKNNQAPPPPTNGNNANANGDANKGSTSEQNGRANSTNGMKRTNDKQTEVLEEEKPKKKVKVDEAEREEQKLKMKKVVKSIVADKEMSLTKLRKKVLKLYHKSGYTDDEGIISKFDKVISKDKFAVNDNLISIAQ